MKKIKVAFCMYQMITGGIEKCLIRLLKKMHEMPEYELTVLVRRQVTERTFLDFFSEYGIPLIEFPNEYDMLGAKPKCFAARKIWRFRCFLFKLEQRKQIKKHLLNKDVIVDYFNCSFYSILKNLNIPKIGWCHSNFLLYSQNLDKNNKNFLNCYDKFVCLTDSFKEKLLPSVPQYLDKIVRIYNFVDVTEIKALAECAPHPQINEKYFVFVGRLHDDKDHSTVIEAFRKFVRYHPDAKMYFVGDGVRREEYEAIVKKYKLDKKIIFTGILNNPLGYIKYAVGNILSSPGEGFGAVLIEAAALKTPNIASDVPDGAREVLLDGLAGFLFPAGDSDKLCALMSDVWENNIDVQNKIQFGIKHLSRFQSENVLPSIDALIKRLVCKP